MFLSIEIELRNHLRGIHSLLGSVYRDSNKDKATLENFVALANRLVTQVGSVNQQGFDPESLEDHYDSAFETFDAIESLSEQSLKSTDVGEEDFRHEMLHRLLGYSERLIAVQQAYAFEVKAMAFSDAISRPDGENIYSRGLSTPWSRGSQPNP